MIATPKMKCGAPILVSADLALAPGQTQSAPLSDLSFGSRYAVLIDEIRFRISSVSKVNPLVPGGFLQDLRGNIRVMLKIGRFNITDSFTPIWSLGRVNSNDIYYSDISADAASLVAGQSRAITACVWRLPVPLYMPPSALIQPAFQYALGSSTALGLTMPTANINVSVAGRAVLPGQPVPARWPIPSSLFYEAAPAAFAANSASELVNPSRNLMHLQRMSLRVWDQRTPLNPVVQYGADWLGRTATEPASPALQYRMRDRLGTYITKDFVPGPLLVDLNSRSWFMDTVLPPDDYLRAEVQQTPNPTSNVEGLWSHIALLGARMEDI
jgi:hypothetical protein